MPLSSASRLSEASVGAPCSSDCGRWATHCLVGILGPGYSLLAPEWDSDVLAYSVGLYPCALFGKYVCAMLTEVIATVSEALAQRSENSDTLSATLAAAHAQLWV
jgi:hypothetical protein